MSFLSRLLRHNFQSYKYNDRKVLPSNIKAVGPTQAKLHTLEVEELDTCIRPLFSNPVTYRLIIKWHIAYLFSKELLVVDYRINDCV